MPQAAPGKLVVVSGPSGAGKSTVLKRVLAHSRLPLTLAISATTRPPRPGEIDGVHYFFLSREEFERRRQAGEFLEWCEVYGRGDLYGTLYSQVSPSLADGKWVVLEIDVQGTLAVLERYPEAITLFVRPATPEDLERRLRGRGTESEAALVRRLEVARRELQQADRYRHQIINDDVDCAVQQICDVLETYDSGGPHACSTSCEKKPS